MVVFFIGAKITQSVAFLRDYNIPEPVTGGFVAALAFWLVYLVFNLEIGFEMTLRDRLLVIFFATVGINAKLSELAAGGRVLGILCALTVGYVFLQNVVGLVAAFGFGLPPAAGVMLGSVALVGGHGTTVAWGPIVADRGFPAALETGIAMATLGLIVASLLGGPIGKFLIERRGLTPTPEEAPPGEIPPEADVAPIDKTGFMRALLWVNVAVILGYLVHEGLGRVSSIHMPLFVPVLLMGIVLSNTVPLVFPMLSWPARSASLDLIGSYSLSVFLAMSLMSMQLWTLAGMAGTLFVALALQAVVAVAFILLVVYPALGRDYQAAVLSGGFTGLSLGATPTAIATMTAITKNYGPAPTAFIVLPLVTGVFVGLVNVAAITLFLNF
jgi:ESS family glutamate:Na+ symporter